jgi:hypothetical protein
MNDSPCEYCGASLPKGVDKDTRRQRSAHFQQHANERKAQQPAETEQEWLDAFIERAGFTYGWLNLESWARRMAEQAYEERQQ